jgi:hypothetical protein
VKSSLRSASSGAEAAAVCLVLVGLAASGKAVAQEGGRLNRLSAEALFDEGLRLMQANDYASACPKLAASYRLDPGIGTLLYLADCYDSEGKTASAWITFREAVFLARKAGDAEREQAALEHADALRHQLTSLQLQMAKPPTGLTLTLDDHTLAPELLNVPLPVDPGSHVLVASAPGYVSWRQSFDIEAAPHVVPVRIPALASTQAAARPAKAPAPEPARGASNLDALGWVAVGVGATAIVGGGAAILAGVDPWPRPIVVCGIGVLSVVGGTLLLTLPSDAQRAPRGGARRARSEPSGWGLGWQTSF